MSATEILRRLLEQAGGPAETGYVLVLEGEGLEDLPDRISTGKGQHAVHRVSTEIELRHLIWSAKGAPLLAVLPEECAQKLQSAPDILRGARNQRVHALAINDVLEVLLGARVIGAETNYLQALALEHVVELRNLMHRRTLPTVIDRALLTELLLDASVGDEVRRSQPGQLLASWVRRPPSWSNNVINLVRGALPSLHGDAGRLLAWALDPAQPDRPTELLVRGAVLTVDAAELAAKVYGPLKQAARELELDLRVVRRAATALAEEAIEALGDEAAPFLVRADSVARTCLTASQLQTSTVLPLAFADRCDVLAKRAAAGEAIGVGDVAWLREHRAARLSEGKLKVLETMAQLTRYLERYAANPRAQPDAAASVLEHVREYQQHGAFADRAITRLLQALASNVDHQKDAEGVIARVRAQRDRANQLFAQRLARGYEPALHAPGVVPLHRVWNHEVVHAWKAEEADRHKTEAELARQGRGRQQGLYLIVLDGCSYPVFLDLLGSLASAAVLSVGLDVGLRGEGDGARRDGLGRAPDDETGGAERGGVSGIAALSPLPTVTSHARGALFLGELPADPLVPEARFREEQEGRTDPPRFRQNAHLGQRTRKLFLKKDLADRGAALLEALDDGAIDVVATVFNVVDDQIGSANTGAAVRIEPTDIVAFVPSLERALAAGRRVLLTADHGFSPYCGLDGKVELGAGTQRLGSRVLGLAGSGAAVPDGFIEIDLAGLGGPPQRRAFAWKTGAYLGRPHVGFHGGCSLEEMVVPLAWLKRDGLAVDEPEWWLGDEPLRPRPQPKPAAPPLAPPPPSEPPPGKVEAGKTEAGKTEAGRRMQQVSLLAPAESAVALGLPDALLATLTQDERAVLVLLESNGSARASELAQRLGKNPVRLNGLLAKLRRKLKTADVDIVASERLPDGETLYKWVR